MSSSVPGTIECAHPVFAGIPVVQEMFSGSAVGLALFDDELRYVWVNPALAQMNGLPPCEHVGRQHHEVARISPMRRSRSSGACSRPVSQ
jgi:PAS domain-containing protein